MMSGVADGEYGPGERFCGLIHAQPGCGHEQLIHVWPTPRYRSGSRHWQLVPENHVSRVWVNVQYLEQKYNNNMLLVFIFIIYVNITSA